VVKKRLSQIPHIIVSIYFVIKVVPQLGKTFIVNHQVVGHLNELDVEAKRVMSKKSVILFCFPCDVDFTIKFSEENTKMTPSYCPFCGEVIDEDDGDLLESDDDEASETNDNWS